MYNEVGVSPIRLFFQQKYVRIILILDVVAILVIIGVVIYNNLKTTVITFNVAPVDATITLNDAKYENGTYKIFPGEYDLVISRSGLDTKTFHLDLPGDSTTEFVTFLSATGSDGKPSFNFYELKANFDSYQTLASIAGSSNNHTYDHDTSAEVFIAEYENQYDLFYSNVIPINYQTFTTDSAGEPLLDNSITIKRANEKAPCQKTLCLESLTIKDDGKNIANNLLEEKGFDLSYVEIIYETF